MIYIFWISQYFVCVVLDKELDFDFSYIRFIFIENVRGSNEELKWGQRLVGWKRIVEESYGRYINGGDWKRKYKVQTELCQ